jgi:hypothetical protein
VLRAQFVASRVVVLTMIGTAVLRIVLINVSHGSAEVCLLEPPVSHCHNIVNEILFIKDGEFRDTGIPAQVHGGNKILHKRQCTLSLNSSMQESYSSIMFFLINTRGSAAQISANHYLTTSHCQKNNLKNN